jgi:hypothetical protein
MGELTDFIVDIFVYSFSHWIKKEKTMALSRLKNLKSGAEIEKRRRRSSFEYINRRPVAQFIPLSTHPPSPC